MSNYQIETIADEKLDQVNGGLIGILVGIAVAVLFEVVNNQEAAKDGFSTGWNH